MNRFLALLIWTALFNGFFFSLIAAMPDPAGASLRDANTNEPDPSETSVCVCSTMGQALCFFEKAPTQVLPPDMCEGKNPGDDPMTGAAQ